MVCLLFCPVNMPVHMAAHYKSRRTVLLNTDLCRVSLANLNRQHICMQCIFVVS